MNIYIFICFIISLIVVYLCIRNGIKTSGKVAYVTAPMPYFLLIILLINGIRLDGAMDGLKYLLIPSISKLFSI